MSQLIVRTIIEDNFNYYKLEDLFDESEINKYSNWIYSRFNSICKKNMDSQLNSEWIVRHYLATKMILSATVMLSSLEYCLEQNVRISVPYLSYYSILTCCRAVTFTLPDVRWNNGDIIEMTHNKIINEVKNCIMKLNKDYGEKLYEQINEYKDYRELFSYKFPATGTGIMDYEHYSYEKTVDICRILCEIAQLNSYQVEKYVNKNCLHNLEEFKTLDKNYLNRCFCYNIDNKNITIIDNEDWYRIDFIRRKQPFPVSIYYTMTEGMVEDFFGAWCPDSDDEDDLLYNPDVNWSIIFPVP